MTVVLLDLMPALWVAVITLSAILEIYSKNISAVWCALSAAAALALSFMDIPPRSQVFVFIAGSAVLAILSRIAFGRRGKAGDFCGDINNIINEEKED